MERRADICIVGGAGHVGLPLSIFFASKGQHVLIYDRSCQSVETIQQGRMPFRERGAEPLLRDALRRGLLSFTTDAKDLAGVPNLVITIGTPVDEFLNPTLSVITACFDMLLPHLSDDQLLILRSTVYPGVTQSIDRYLQAKGKKPLLSFCPERIVEGNAIEELQVLPQIVSGTTAEAEEKAAQLFSLISPGIVRLAPLEAELVKLFSNAFRYIQFAVANQFYMIATSAGVDYYRLLNGMKKDYPRLKDLPPAGFAAGPCLFKDTIQLSAFYRNQFGLGLQAMLVNEGIPQFIVDRLAAHYPLGKMTVGLLGMAFKAESDDTRSSLSYKLKKLLMFRTRAVLTTDPYVSDDPELRSLEEVTERSDILILCAPHQAYRDVPLAHKVLVDIWNFWGKGSFVEQPTAVARE